jgi:hypothetical protein
MRFLTNENENRTLHYAQIVVTASSNIEMREGGDGKPGYDPGLVVTEIPGARNCHDVHPSHQQTVTQVTESSLWSRKGSEICQYRKDVG